MYIAKVLIAAFASLLSENLVLSRGIGSSTMLIAARSKRQLMGVSLCLTYFCVACSELVWLIGKTTSLTENDLFLPFLYTCVTAFVYIATLLILRCISVAFFDSIKKFIHLSAFNCTVLGCLLLNKQHMDSFMDSTFFGLNCGLGFLIAAYMLKIVDKQLNSENIPESFRGYPITMIYLGIISMAVYCFT